jgi:hypothetical protein
VVVGDFGAVSIDEGPTTGCYPQGFDGCFAEEGQKRQFDAELLMELCHVGGAQGSDGGDINLHDRGQLSGGLQRAEHAARDRLMDSGERLDSDGIAVGGQSTFGSNR